MPRAVRLLVLVPVAVLALVQVAIAQADKGWPRELKTDKGVLTIYQPQPEKFQDNVLEARAAT